MSTQVTGYTGINIDGLVSMQTGELTGIVLSSGDRVLTQSEQVNGVLSVTTGHATNAIVVSGTKPGNIFIVVNNDGVNPVNIKVLGGTAVTIAAGKTAIVRVNSAGTDVKRVTADV